jgi:hypothetical protein
MVTPEPFPVGWWARCHGARDNTRALSHWEAGLELWDTWRHWSPSLSSGVPGATGHMVMPELSDTRSGSGAAETHDGTRALPYRVRSLAPWD